MISGMSTFTLVHVAFSLPFKVTQLTVLVLFVVLTIATTIKFRPALARAA
jgi:hypothetical protein